MRTRIVIASFAVLAVLGAIGAVIWKFAYQGGVSLPVPIRSEYCTAQTDGEVTLGLDQMANAATITAVGIRRGVPERAVTIALATALQESKLNNLDGGDRDSIGLFQQRPSQGWGTPTQIADARYAANRFYAALLHVKNWPKLTVTAAAQAVQHSAHPDAYQKWSDEAAILAAALMGDKSAAVTCSVSTTPHSRGPQALAELTGSLQADWGKLTSAMTTTPDSVSLAVIDSHRGWQYAHWLVAHASLASIQRIQFGNLAWTATEGTWQAVKTASTHPTSMSTDTVIAQVFSAPPPKSR
ncbi:MAG TPA: hypothetical protein VH442_14520 [Micromonosporaceae bacterium]